MEQESQMIQGTVLAVIYQNPENGYCVLKVRSEQGEAVTIYRLSASEPQLERQVRAFVWSRESGLAGGRLILAGGEEPPETAALAKRLAAQYACVEYRPCAACRE